MFPTAAQVRDKELRLNKRKPVLVAVRLEEDLAAALRKVNPNLSEAIRTAARAYIKQTV